MPVAVSEVWKQASQDLRRSSGRRSLKLCATLFRPLFALISRNVSGFIFKVTCLPDSWIQNPRPQIIGMKHFLKTLT